MHSATPTPASRSNSDNDSSLRTPFLSGGSQLESQPQSQLQSESPNYLNQDRRPTSWSELWGWYSYGVAAEVFAICGVGSFLPVTLEQLARERGVLRKDGATPCVLRSGLIPSSEVHQIGDIVASPKSVVRQALHLFFRTVVEPPNRPSVSVLPNRPSISVVPTVPDSTFGLQDQHAGAGAPSQANQASDNACVVPVLGLRIDSASFAMYTISLAVLVQLVVLVSISAVADRGKHRKRLLITLAFIGSISCMLFVVVTPELFLLAPALAIISITCLGNTFVLLNAFLPLLVANYPAENLDQTVGSEYFPIIQNDELRDAIEMSSLQTETSSTAERSHQGDDQENIKPLGSSSRPPSVKFATVALSNKISATGVAAGYAAAVFMQIMGIFIILSFRNSTESTDKSTQSTQTMPMRTVLFFVGMWWAFFSLPTLWFLRPRPGPPLPPTLGTSRLRRFVSTLAFSWAALYRTVRTALRLRNLSRFLLGWFLLSDSMATVSGTAILFARTELRMGMAAVAMVSITSTLSGIAGAAFWPWIDRRWHERVSSSSAHHSHQEGPNAFLGGQPGRPPTTRTLIFIIFLFAIIPVYALLAFVPAIRSLGYFGLQQQWEIFPMAIVHGLVMGGFSSLTRSLYSILIPPGHEAAFFALYAVTDKGSSVVGPVLVGIIIDKWGQIRYAFWGLVVMVLLPVPVLWSVDLKAGREEAVEESKRMKSESEEHHGYRSTGAFAQATEEMRPQPRRLQEWSGT